MVRIDGDVVTVHRRNGQLHRAIRRISGKYHAGFNLFDAFKGTLRHNLHQGFIVFAVGVQWFNHHVKFVPAGFTQERTLQARNNIMAAVQVDEGIVRFGAVDQDSIAVLHIILERHYLIFFNHWVVLSITYMSIKLA